jgi:hypothetical protein
VRRVQERQRYKSDTSAARASFSRPNYRQHAGNIDQGDGNISIQAPAVAVHQPHQQGNEPCRNRLRARDLQRDFEQDDYEVYNSPQANLGAALAALGQLEDTPVMRRL